MVPNKEIILQGNKIVLKDDKKKEILDVCEGVAKKRGLVAEIETKEELIINLESFGQMSAEEIFVNSIETLKKDLNDFSKRINKA